jgi:tRNA-splicing ligase RtcB
VVEEINKRLMNWASILDPATREQAVRTSTMPFIHPHVALMPDAHLGKGATVGSVIPTVGAIIPAAVGVDIGCGMMAVRTGLSAADLPGDRQALHGAISRAVPLSAGKYNTRLYGEDTAARVAALEAMRGIEQAEAVAPNWRMQLGSLGSGNHFIEVSLDEDGGVWLFLHSGSRGVGNKLAGTHIKLAQEQCRQRWINLPDPDLAYLVEGDAEFLSYVEALRWAQRFAYLNREEMMQRVVDCFQAWTGGAVEPVETISRTAAKRLFTRQDLDARMDGIAWGRSDAFLDEHPDAYKDIDVVMADAAELVSIDHTLRQIVNVKGD